MGGKSPYVSEDALRRQLDDLGEASSGPYLRKDSLKRDAPLADFSEQVQGGLEMARARRDDTLQMRSDIKTARGVFQGNGAAQVHVDAVAPTSLKWCDAKYAEGEKRKAKDVKDAAAAAMALVSAHPDLETRMLDSQRGGEDAALAKALKNLRWIQARSPDEYVFGGMSNDDAFRYRRCQRHRDESMTAREAYNSAQTQEERKSAAKTAAQADDAYAGVNERTQIPFLEKALYYGEIPLNAASLLPVVGTPSALLLASIYYANGQTAQAAMVAFVSLPGAKILSTGVKMSSKAARAIKVLIGSHATAEIKALAKLAPEEAAKILDKADLSDKTRQIIEKAVAKERAINATREADIAAEKEAARKSGPKEAAIKEENKANAEGEVPPSHYGSSD